MLEECVTVNDGQLEVEWFTGTITSQWNQTLPTPGRSDEQPWMETIPSSAVITFPFNL